MNPLLLSQTASESMNELRTMVAIPFIFIGTVILLNLAVLIGLIVFIVKNTKKNKK